MSLPAFIFYFFLLVAASSAVGILFSKNVFKAALLLLLCLLSVAALYVLAFAEFIAITQILIYAGGLLVVIIFGIMITTNLTGKPLLVSHSNIFSGILAGSLLLGLLINLISGIKGMSLPTGSSTAISTLEIIGVNLITKFALPFELTGVLLLVALIGAAVMASFMKSKKT
jgi:NADH:ubiquinone oxidoreductase subunit 6 (subunit J)